MKNKTKLIIVLLVSLVLGGCSNLSKKPETILPNIYPQDSHFYVLPETKVIIAPYETLNEKFKEFSGYDFRVNGFYNTKTKEVWVIPNSILDVNGEVMPNSFVLGHEIWHTVKPDFHKNDPNNYMLPELPGLIITLQNEFVN